MDIRKVFATNVRRYREAAGLSQAGLADKIGADRAHVSSMERAQQNVTIVTLWHVSEALGVRAAALLEEPSGLEEAEEEKRA
ncbi:helix-turn-helix transcriptional regulator [Brevundimonas sp.]|uniref:helix-turn-helix domain-containing protein n=1 Tax=Brevundimonas sp. TaxID=1871086 RepID=UPI002E0DE492|nr:helix-turn-helix transcriptional regulator [Brevundimonas sp.]